MRDSNLDALPLTDADLRKLDASVKRNTALIKRLRSVSEESKAGLLEEISRTNQSKVDMPPVQSGTRMCYFWSAAGNLTAEWIHVSAKNDLSDLHLCAQYVSEAVTAISEANVKTKDIAAAVEVSSVKLFPRGRPSCYAC